MTSSQDCALYAELLANIRQISLAASLPSASDGSTQVALAADCCTVELRHRGCVCRLTLPARTPLGGTRLAIQEKQQGATTLSWRLPLDVTSSALPAHPGDHLPWSATDLHHASGVACRRCGTSVVPSGAVQSWKDLPSENWAEMMEFWHCHKPDHHHHGQAGGPGKADEANLVARGYGASSTISAQQGVGFVDLTSLLFAESDCQNLTFSLSSPELGSTDRQNQLARGIAEASQTRSLNIFCSSCQSQLGFFNFRTSAATLLKWQVSCESRSGAVPGISECLAATLISTMARSGSSKSLIMPIAEAVHGRDASAGAQDVMHVWVLNSGIVYSSTGASRRCTPAVKLLYRAIRREEADKMLESVSCDSQEISLPAPALAEVIGHLDASNALLPPTERLFKDWKVGLLSRWDAKV